MPTYEYKCMHCSYNFEVFQNITDQPIEVCPKCHKRVKRLIGSGSGIIFKGPGFYATDYRNKLKNKTSDAKNQIVCPKAKEGCDACQQ